MKWIDYDQWIAEMNWTGIIKDDQGVEYFNSLPKGYVKLPVYKEIFDKVDILTTLNAKVREGLILILYNPAVNKYYPRQLFHGSNRADLLKYQKDGNLYISVKDVIWSDQLTLL